MLGAGAEPASVTRCNADLSPRPFGQQRSNYNFFIYMKKIPPRHHQYWNGNENLVYRHSETRTPVAPDRSRRHCITFIRVGLHSTGHC